MLAMARSCEQRRQLFSPHHFVPLFPSGSELAAIAPSRCTQYNNSSPLAVFALPVPYYPDKPHCSARDSQTLPVLLPLACMTGLLH
jgi:hypothetical protein